MKCVINMCIHTFIHSSTHSCVCQHTHTQTQAHRHTHTDTRTQTHTHTQTQHTQTHNTYTCARRHTDIVSHGLCYHKHEKISRAKLSQIPQFSRVLQNFSHEKWETFLFPILNTI